MKKIIILTLLIANSVIAQKKEFLDNYRGELNTNNALNKFNNYDFSEIWTATQETAIYGIIGENHQRIRIKILSVEKNPKNKNEYFVSGKSKVKSNICDFKGLITLEEIRIVKELYNGVDDFYKGKIKQQGLLIASYRFEENKFQKGTGIFKGKLYSSWCIFNDSKDKVSYDSIDEGDSHKNNSFVGVWQSYRSGKTKICNWGDWRVPMANEDFDFGAGDFSPSDKYLKFGWNNYRKALLGDKKAREIEGQKWWE